MELASAAAVPGEGVIDCGKAWREGRRGRIGRCWQSLVRRSRSGREGRGGTVLLLSAVRDEKFAAYPVRWKCPAIYERRWVRAMLVVVVAAGGAADKGGGGKSVVLERVVGSDTLLAGLLLALAMGAISGLLPAISPHASKTARIAALRCRSSVAVRAILFLPVPHACHWLCQCDFNGCHRSTGKASGTRNPPLQAFAKVASRHRPITVYWPANSLSIAQ